MNVVSYAFFRNDASAYESDRCGASKGKFFVGFLPAVVRAHHSVYPDYELRIHHDERVREYPYFRVLESLASRGMLRLVAMGEAHELCESMLWRLAPCWDESVDRVICRDVDSLSTPRERLAVEEWIAGGKPIHSIHDSPSHKGALILGGLCGFRAEYIRSRFETVDFLYYWIRWHGLPLTKLGDDQRALTRLFQNIPIHHFHGPYTGPHPDPRDQCGGHARCLGGAYHAHEVAKWYDEHHPNETIIKCEKELL
jgi:hypothetical protein